MIAHSFHLAPGFQKGCNRLYEQQIIYSISKTLHSTSLTLHSTSLHVVYVSDGIGVLTSRLNGLNCTVQQL